MAARWTGPLTSLALSALTAASAQTSDRGALIARIDSLVEAEVRDGPTAGMSVAVYRRGELLHTKAYGFADLENRVPASVETVYRLGSVTKQFTAAAVLQLAEQGKISLDEDFTRYLPDFSTGGRRVSVTQLLNHTSGIKSYTSLGEAVSRDSFRVDLPPARLLALIRSQPFDFEPGTSWLYNNSGFYLLGQIIERVSGESYADYLRHHLFESLGLESTSYCDERAVVRHRAKGYDRAEHGFRNTTPISMSIPYAAGSLCSTVLDLVAWRRALANGRVISRASYQRMIAPTLLAGGWRTNYGFGLARYRLGGGPNEVVRHGGTINGFQANLMYLPGDDLIVAALANTSGSDPVGVSDRIAAAVLGLELPMVRDEPVPAEEAARYTGRYRLGPWTVEVRLQGDRLVAAQPGLPPSRLLAQGGRRFVARPVFAFGLYGTETTLRFEPGSPSPGLSLDHPLGGTAAAKRVNR